MTFIHDHHPPNPSLPTTTSSSRPPLPRFRTLPPPTTLVRGGGGSRLQGAKKAVLIGINYVGTEYALKGCFHDIMATRQLLVTQFGYLDTPETMQVLSDVGVDAAWRPPTRRNMLQAMHWLVQHAMPGDALFLHYSGHGGSMREVLGSPVSDNDDDNVDDDDDDVDDDKVRTRGTDVIVPVDAEEAGVITQHELHMVLVTQVPRGVTLTVVFDSCHATVPLDLPCWYGTENNTIVYHRRRPGALDDSGADASAGGGRVSATRSLPRRLSHSVMNFFLGRRKSMPSKGTPQGGQVLMFVGHRIDTASFEEVQEEGAMSWTFNMVLKSKPVLSYAELLHSMRDIMQTAFHQLPKLGSSHTIDLDEVFTL